MMRLMPLLLGMLLSMPVFAVIETYEFSDPALEERYQRLSAELRCPKCQNQNIADSNAPIAQDLRRLLHAKLEEGNSDDEILDHMVARYGEFVLYRPRFEGANLALWLAPAGLLLLGVVVVLISIRSRSAAASGDQGLSEQDRAALSSLLDEKDPRR